MINKVLAEELSKEHAVFLITSKFRDTPASARVNGVEIYRVPVLARHDRNAATLLSMLSFFPSSLLQGYRVVREQQIDIVHSMFVIPSAPSGFLLAKLFGLPHVLSMLGGDIYDPSKKLSPHRNAALRIVVRSLLTKSDVVIGMSTDIIDKAHRYYGISRDIVKIPHGIQKPVFQRQSREAFGYWHEDILLITIGRLIPRKSTQDLIKVVAMLRDLRVRLVIIGDGPEKQRLLSYTAQCGVTERVHFLGNVDDATKFQLLDIADIYVSSTQHEGFGLVFLEAMTCGLPVVSYDNGGHVDFLINGKTGFLVKLGDVELLAHRIRELSENEALRKEMALFNRKHVEQFYIENCAEQYQEVYRSLY